jgi:hypothetical protein
MMSDGAIKADDTVSAEIRGEVKGDVALVGQEFVVGAGAKEL